MKRSLISGLVALAVLGGSAATHSPAHAAAAHEVSRSAGSLTLLNSLAEVRSQSGANDLNITTQGSSSGAQAGVRTYAWRMFGRVPLDPRKKGVFAVINTMLRFKSTAAARSYLPRAIKLQQATDQEAQAILHPLPVKKTSVHLNMPGSASRLLLYWGAGQSNLIQTNARVVFQRGSYVAVVSVQSAGVSAGYNSDAVEAANLGKMIDERITGR